jgi:hypothetical protein
MPPISFSAHHIALYSEIAAEHHFDVLRLQAQHQGARLGAGRVRIGDIKEENLRGETRTELRVQRRQGDVAPGRLFGTRPAIWAILTKADICF